jgi:hypothetical protein
MHKTGILTLLFLLVSISLFAQQKLNGTITDQTTGLPVAFATVQAKGAPSVLSNQSGDFEILVPALPATVTISHINFQAITLKSVKAEDMLKISMVQKILNLKEVTVGNPAIAIMQAASDKGMKNAAKAHYGKAFLRQIAYDTDKPVYMNEMFFDAEWKAYGLLKWHPSQARHLAASRGLSYNNFSFYSFVLSGYLTNNFGLKPLLGRVDSLYTFKLAGTFDQGGQEIAKISCTPKSKIKGQRFQGTYYINTVTDEVLKIEGSILGVVFHGGGPISVKNEETVFVAQYRINKNGDNVLDYSLLNTSNKIKLMGFGVQRTDLFSTLYMADDEQVNQELLTAITPEIDDTKTVKAMTFDPAFWKANQGIKRTEREQTAIEYLEKIPQKK